jgi:1-acyl-sn-glycerol-3-phosphate acyltransferase
MKKITLEEFRNELLSTGAYCTSPEHKPKKRVRSSWMSTLNFSLKVAKVFPACAIMQPLGLLTVKRWSNICFGAIQCAEKLGMNVILEGFEQRQAYKGPVVYVANHISTYETIALPPIVLTYTPFNVVAKASLAHLPFLEKAAERMGLVPIGRKNPKEDLINMIRIGTEKISQGRSFLIFPQGTRQEVFSRKKFSSIGAKLAEKAGCPVVPIAVDTRCQPPREKGIFKKIFHDFGPLDTSKDIRFSCGPVIKCEKARDMHESSFNWLADKLESWSIPVER